MHMKYKEYLWKLHYSIPVRLFRKSQLNLHTRLWWVYCIFFFLIKSKLSFKTCYGDQLPKWVWLCKHLVFVTLMCGAFIVYLQCLSLVLNVFFFFAMTSWQSSPSSPMVAALQINSWNPRLSFYWFYFAFPSGGHITALYGTSFSCIMSLSGNGRYVGDFPGGWSSCSS